MTACAILAAAGRGERMGQPKQLLALEGRPIAAWSLEALAQAPSVTAIVIASEPAQRDAFQALAREFGCGKVTAVVSGGASRQESVWSALGAMTASCDVVAVHDGARPFAGSALVEQVITLAHTHGGAIAAVPVKDTIKQVDEGGAVQRTIPRAYLWAAQTPQAFGYDLLRRAHERAQADGFTGTDDAELVERIGSASIAIVQASPDNLKITTPEDLLVAQRIAATKTHHRTT